MTENNTPGKGNAKKGKKTTGNPGGLPSFKFNIGYIYGLLIIAFFAIQFFGTTGTPVETNWQEVKSTMLRNGDVEKL